jgi:hypothetical protein
MRVIRPSVLDRVTRRRSLLLATSMLAVGVLAGQLAIVLHAPTGAIGLMGLVAALGLGIGVGWLLRALRPSRTRAMAAALVDLLAPAFDDAYTLVVAPRLPVRDANRLDGILVGPAGVRVLTARDWEGRYRVRGRVWEFDAHGRRGWIRCRTNPSFEAVELGDGVTRWAASVGLSGLPIRPAVAFPHGRSRIVLEEPTDEIVTRDNAPWWANTIGRVRRLDAAGAARLVAAVLDAAERPSRVVEAVRADRPS